MTSVFHVYAKCTGGRRHYLQTLFSGTRAECNDFVNQGHTMKYTTTLAALREHCADIDAYNKLVCSLMDQQFDAWKEDWIECDHSDPISLSYILETSGLDYAIWTLRTVEQTPELARTCRLFAVWCARQVQHLMTDPRSIAAPDVAERYANGQATDAELAAARAAAGAAAVHAAAHAATYARVVDGRAVGAAASDAAGSAVGTVAADGVWAACVAAVDAADASRIADQIGERDAQRAKFIEMFCTEDTA